MLAQLQLKREKSDYDDFYVVSKEEADIQYQNAEIILTAVLLIAFLLRYVSFTYSFKVSLISYPKDSRRSLSHS